MHRYIFFLLIFFSLFQGCTVGPKREPLDLKISQEWQASMPGNVVVKSTEATRWWELFNDPKLNELVQIALKKNHDLRLAKSRILEAKAMWKIARADFFPHLSAGATTTRSMQSFANLGLKNDTKDESTYTPQEAAIATVFGFETERSREHFETGFDVFWELDFFGRVKSQTKANWENFQAVLANKDDVIVSLLGEVARNYIQLRSFQRQISILNQHVKSQREILDLMQDRFDAGMVSSVDLALEEGDTALIDTKLSILENIQSRTINRLMVLLGLNTEQAFDLLKSSTKVPVITSAIHVGIPSELLRRRPDVRFSEKKLDAAIAQEGVAIADLYPRLTLNAKTGWNSRAFSNVYQGKSEFWIIKPNLHLPIFQAGKIRANIKIHNQKSEQALILYEKTILLALEEVENALNSYYHAQKQNRSLRKVYESHKEAYEKSQELFESGIYSYNRVLDVKNLIYNSEIELAKSDGSLSTQVVALYKALGGGWEYVYDESKETTKK